MIGHGRNEGQSKEALSSLEIASILEGHLDTGYSVDRYGDSPQTGYAIGVRYTETRFSATPSHNEVLAFVERIGKCVLPEAPMVFGVWHNEGHWYLELSVIYQDRENAITLGKSTGQLAIYDCAKQEEIRLDGESAEKCSTCKAPKHTGMCEVADIPADNFRPRNHLQRHKPPYVLAVERAESEELDAHADTLRGLAEPREHVSGDSRVSVAEELSGVCKPCSRLYGRGMNCKGCAYNGAERAGKCSVCPVER